MPEVGYRTQIIILSVWILVVMLLFRLMPDRQVAATLAGIGFVLWPVLFLVSEYLRRPALNTSHIIVLGVFLLFCALPILLLRVLNWGVPFDQLSFMGIPGPVIHKASNYIYILMLVSAIYHYVRTRRQAAK